MKRSRRILNTVHNDISQKLIEQINDAVDKKLPLVITGGGSKAFYGNHVEGEIISTAKHTGIIEYQPSELVVTVRSGTLLKDLEAELRANKQMLAFEPPQHSDNTTIGGIIACGLSGPRRVACGSARDFVLGTNIINGRGEKCRFGGQVMKNVAGYDASRLMTGAQGTLGLLLDISLKVLPINEKETSIKIEVELQTAIKNIKHWVKHGLPVSASCFYKNNLYLRLSSTHSAVQKSLDIINKSCSSEKIDHNFWSSIKDQTHEFFSTAAASEEKDLWRFSSVAASSLFDESDDRLIEWNGALCWIKSELDLHDLANKNQANATRYPLNSANKKADENIFQPLQPGLLKIHQRLKQAFDPEHILNPGRLYSEL